MPRRRGPSLALLGTLAAIPAVALGMLYVVADAKAEVHKVPPATTDTAVRGPGLTTPLLSVRRAPTPLAADVRGIALQAAATPLIGAIDGTSCAAVAIDDHVVASANPDAAVIPASNLKVLVAAVALDVLGPTTTFTTQVLGPAPAGGVVTGDVYLVGGGDPVLSQQWWTQITPSHKRPPLHPTSVEGLADALKAAGVTQITGKLIGDGSRYDGETYPPGWTSDIRSVVDGVPVGALVIDDSVGTNGVISTDPTAAAARTFSTLLGTKGVTVAGGTATGVAPVGLTVLASVQSAPLSDLVNEMLATSDNLTAEMLVKEIGKSVSGSATRTAGLAAISQRLTGWGVPTNGLTLTDGSGLSRDNRVTCSTMMGVLLRGTASDAIGAGMARGAQPGTTLAEYFSRDGLGGVIQGKTGSLKEVKSLGGYFVSGTDEVAFIVILNGATAASFLPVWEKLGNALLAIAGTPTADGLGPVAS